MGSLRDQVDQLTVVDVSPRSEVRNAPPPGLDHVIDGSANHGYGWACNLGIAAADGDLVLISNPDVVYEPGSVAAVARAAADGALVTPVQTDRRGSRDPADTYDSLQMGISVAASANRWTGLGRRRFDADRAAALTRDTEVLEVPGGMTLGGASMMTTRATWDRLGGFDERYFLYQDDADLSLRARAAGIPLRIALRALVFHESGSARAGLDTDIMRWAVTSERIAWRAYGLPVGVLVVLQRAGMLGRALRDLRAGRRTEAHQWWHFARRPLTGWAG
ncbi:glycosyltransferase [Actinomycetospora sp. OC33-EN08]|uniref:Glycosyltransferase n=1 Tax=Actinomycetospora aurantiaca TaxID=3129233 RepID=A0ABU8MIY8_9PSEU